MRVFLAGATGAIGRPLVAALLTAGHEVTGMTRSPARADALRAAGAEAAIADALDPGAVRAAVAEAAPEAVVNQLTSIPPRVNPRAIARDFALTNRLRTEGARNLIAAARDAGAQRLIAQSIAFIYAAGPRGTVRREQDPLLAPERAPQSFRPIVAAVGAL
ncbi:MAG: NAD(P)H-binding protein, partial [Solirubrobacterales bacterium]|nr:NAD(P)H-binding protein [Solirubrobacterales bacterium]